MEKLKVCCGIWGFTRLFLIRFSFTWSFGQDLNLIDPQEEVFPSNRGTKSFDQVLKSNTSISRKWALSAQIAACVCFRAYEAWGVDIDIQ